METIDVFVDLENVGLSWNVRRETEAIALLDSSLEAALEREGYALGTVTGFASYARGGRGVPQGVQRDIREMFVSRGWEMVWSREIADEALVKRIRERKAKNELAVAVMIASNDHDFSEIIRWLQGEGHFVLAAGDSLSETLRTTATKAVNLREFLSVEFKKGNETPLNPIRL